ncbi:hypothetical protein G9A89_011462 [Geosiphon pyriformis]|nr:hypothetical protein G9A89_011462 [Geosiphon pyriformis]
MSLMEWSSTLASVYMAVISFSSSVAPLNKDVDDSSLSSNEKIAASNLSLVTVTGGMLLIVAATDKLQALLVNKLGLNILVVNKLAVASFGYNEVSIDFNLGINSEFEIVNQSFDIDFLIINYYYRNSSQFSNGLVYHNCSRYASLPAIAD